jgi:uncharacterized damage-inducible protein DinB
MRVDCLTEVIEAAREYLAYAASLVAEDKREWKPTQGAWSLKDILAHIAWHDDQMVELCETKDLAGSPWWDLPTDERNRKIYEKYDDTPIDAVLAFAEDAYARMLGALKSLSDEDLNDPKRYIDMPDDWIPWRMIANNTCEHYLRHIGQIRKLARDGSA